MRWKIPSEISLNVDKHRIARENEEKSKLYNKQYADKNRNTKNNEINVGDSVLMRQKRRNKLMTKYNPAPCTVIETTGSEVTVMTKNGTHVCRNKSHFKKLPLAITMVYN